MTKESAKLREHIASGMIECFCKRVGIVDPAHLASCGWDFAVRRIYTVERAEEEARGIG